MANDNNQNGDIEAQIQHCGTICKCEYITLICIIRILCAFVIYMTIYYTKFAFSLMLVSTFSLISTCILVFLICFIVDRRINQRWTILTLSKFLYTLLVAICSSVELAYFILVLTSAIDTSDGLAFVYIIAIDAISILSIIFVKTLMYLIQMYLNRNTTKVSLESVVGVEIPIPVTSQQKEEIIAKLNSNSENTNNSTVFTCVVCTENLKECDLNKTCGNVNCDESHNLCNGCFNVIKSKNDRCPLCRGALLEKPITRFPIHTESIYDILSELEIIDYNDFDDDDDSDPDLNIESSV